MRSEKVKPYSRVPQIGPVATTSASICWSVRPTGSSFVDRTSARCSSFGRENARMSAARRRTAGSRALRRFVHMMTAAGSSALAIRVDTADERVDASAVLVMHLRRLPRLRERIGLIDEQDNGATCTSGCRF